MIYRLPPAIMMPRRFILPSCVALGWQLSLPVATNPRPTAYRTPVVSLRRLPLVPLKPANMVPNTLIPWRDFRIHLRSQIIPQMGMVTAYLIFLPQATPSILQLRILAPPMTSILVHRWLPRMWLGRGLLSKACCLMPRLAKFCNYSRLMVFLSTTPVPPIR